MAAVWGISGSTASRPDEHTVAAALLEKDRKYKKYSQQVEKCLSTFENIHDWADCTAFLTRLLKILQAFPQFKEIPWKLTVSKRLAQCLNPALPTGVHQRALDVYSHILVLLGPDGLKRDLQYWSTGLLPFFEYASTSIKPIVLNLYETHYLPLGAHMRPIMKAFILALLPGLEEETSEYFDKVLAILDRAAETISPAFFFQNVWLVMLTSPNSRPPAINFLTRRLPKFKEDDDVTPIVGKDVGLMLRAFASALEGENLLVRRGTLDLLVNSLRLNSAAIRRSQPSDRTIVMRAAISVVLRRDLSLNRRLYTWLLGPDEKSEHQTAYFKLHSLDLLCDILREDILDQVSDPDIRPFKILIYVQDKWEIGSPLTDNLIYDAFKTVKRMTESKLEDSSEIYDTVQELFDAVQPLALWRRIFKAIDADISNSSSSSIEGFDLMSFILHTLEIREEEMWTVHLPVIFNALMEYLDAFTENENWASAVIRTAAALQVCKLMLPHLPLQTLYTVFNPFSAENAGNDRCPYARACILYGVPARDLSPRQSTASTPLAVALQSLVRIADIDDPTVQSIYTDVLSLSVQIIDHLQDTTGQVLPVDCRPSSLPSAIHKKIADGPFDVIDLSVHLYSALRSPPFPPMDPKVDERMCTTLITTLVGFIRRDYAAYHLPLTNHIWSLQKNVKSNVVGGLFAKRLAEQRENQETTDAFEAFGCFWRMSDDTMLPGNQLKIPLLLVLGSLSNSDPFVRQLAEVWMRSYPKSFLRLLEPLLCDILDLKIRRAAKIVKLQGRELQAYEYETNFDQQQILYALEAVLSLLRFGGPMFCKVLQTTSLQKSPYPSLLSLAQRANVASAESTFSEALVDLIVRLIQTEPKSSLYPVMASHNRQIQATSVDILHYLTTRGDFDLISINHLQGAICTKLFIVVHTRQVSLQSKLLHLLHSIIYVSINLSKAADATHSVDNSSRTSLPRAADASNGTKPVASALPSLLLQTLIDGLSFSYFQPASQSWFDFISAAISMHQKAMIPLLSPLIECVCRLLRQAMQDLHFASSNDKNRAKVPCTAETDILSLLTTLERLVLLSVNSPGPEISEPDQSNPNEKLGGDAGGFLGIMSNVFGSEQSSGNGQEAASIRPNTSRSLQDAVQTLVLIWKETSPESSGMIPLTLTLLTNTLTKTRARCKKVFEKIFSALPLATLEYLVDCWHFTFQEGLRDVFDIVDTLTPTAQDVVQMICDSILVRMSPGIDRMSRMWNPDMHEALFLFLEEYLKQLEAPLAVQVWNRCTPLAKEIIANSQNYRYHVLSMLRCVVILGNKMAQTPSLDDKKLRKDFQDTFTKLLDANAILFGKISEQSLWLRRGSKDVAGIDGSATDEKAESTEGAVLPDTDDPSPAFNNFVALDVIPSLRTFLQDSDKITAACSNLIYYIVNPAVKSKLSNFDVDSDVLGILQAMSKVPSSSKAWKGLVLDSFFDNRFFNMPPPASSRWSDILRSLLEHDRQVFQDILGKISSSPSGNIFANREYENITKSRHLRRLAYALFIGRKNDFLNQLPAIQEKLVEVLRVVTSPMVHSEVYLCIRVLLCRLSAHNLSGIWPVVISELIRLFQQILAKPNTEEFEGSEDLQLILSACKLIDLMLILQTEEFQTQQWMFITDTVDSIYPPDDWRFESLLDRLGEYVRDQPNNKPRAQMLIDYRPHSASSTSFNPKTSQKQPLLAGVRSIQSIHDLAPFFSHISIASYEALYACRTNVDWDNVEAGLLEQLFDGR
ncbi:hypothetical protein SISNIDRAFT_441139 [Sistotremastrum niveocremeum HHB9708]|uniref:Uncharacterized protein n=1 Tax=Sistotremastrum niveocremeum HHB9708 TaxID=1314777 RepID=A0A164UKS4_9AGAM|nr:hypothetical protein SISNIDRAFT_441139 [Sistotremastrum niveocremeum HHB9708]